MGSTKPDPNKCDICGKPFQDGARILPIQLYSIGKKGVRSIQPPHAYMHLHHIFEPQTQSKARTITFTNDPPVPSAISSHLRQNGA